MHAIASAGVAFAVTRSCAEGSAAICGCSSRHQGSPGEGWKWGGCSEDIEFGGMVSREFADARENRPDARSAMNRHNNEAGRQVRLRPFPVLGCKLESPEITPGQVLVDPNPGPLRGVAWSSEGCGLVEAGWLAVGRIIIVARLEVCSIPTQRCLKHNAVQCVTGVSRKEGWEKGPPYRSSCTSM